MKTSANQFQAEFLRKNPTAQSLFHLFGHLPLIYFYVKDTQSRFVHVNQNVLSIYDLRDEKDVIGKTDRDFHPPVLAEAYIAEDQRVLKTGRAITGELWLVSHIRGTPQWFVSSKTPLFDPRGKVIGLAGAMFQVEHSAEQERYFGKLKTALDFLHVNFAKVVSVPLLAKQCGLSITTFNRQFRELLKMTPTEYLLSWRIETARKQLVKTQRSLSEIAAECGFADQSHFTKRFRRITGMTPLNYRKQFKA